MVVPTMVGLRAGTMAIGLLDTAFTAVGTAAGAAVGYVGYAIFFYQWPCGIDVLQHDLTYWLW